MSRWGRSYYIHVLKECMRKGSYGYGEGKGIHGHIISTGSDSDLYLANTLLEMYTKCRTIAHARQAFNRMPRKNLFSWTLIISAYAHTGHGAEALSLFAQMEEVRVGDCESEAAQVKPDRVLYLSLLRACACLGDLKQGRMVHSRVRELGSLDVALGSALVDMYAKCGSLADARRVFDGLLPQSGARNNSVLWNVMISGCTRNGCSWEALSWFKRMQRHGVRPDRATIVAVTKACACVGEVEMVHACAQDGELDSDVAVAAVLVDAYFKFGCADCARRTFEGAHMRNVVLWTAMVSGFVHLGCGGDALAFFRQMQQNGIKPNAMTFASAIAACAGLAALDQGKRMHAALLDHQQCLDSDTCIANALIDMYAKCGSLEDAMHTFACAHVCRDVVSWTAMIAAYARHGRVTEALSLFEHMQQNEGDAPPPNELTFTCIISGCSHAGLVEEGLRIFDTMVHKYGIDPTPEHCACVVDLLSRKGLLGQAERFILETLPPPSRSSVSLWTALLRACRIQGNTELGRHIVERMAEFEPEFNHPSRR